MIYRKKFLTTLSLVAAIYICVAAAKAPVQKERNLKILPEDISNEKLDSIMHSYNIALGVQCNFCHVPMKGFTDSLNYESDEDPMKENARKMMRMTIDINKNNFWYDKNAKPVFLNTVACKTCHRGHEFPPED